MLLSTFEKPLVLLISVAVMLFALIFHNVTQAFVASKYGDQTPKHTGYLSFDFKKHLDPMGVLFLVLLGLGWSHNVPVNKRNYRGKGFSEAIVWYSGSLAFFLVAFSSLLIAEACGESNLIRLAEAFSTAALYAVFHGVVHLFPVWPLDGARAALVWGNHSVRNFVYKIQSFYPFGFIVFFLLLSFSGILQALGAMVLNSMIVIVRNII